MYDNTENKKGKIREKIDTIIINNPYDIERCLIDALANNGFELDISIIDRFNGPPKKEINIYRVIPSL